MIEGSFHLEISSSLKLFVRWFKPTNKNGNVIHILHGMGEHSGRYTDFARFLVSHGYTVYAHDHRNHGHSLKDEKSLGIFNKYETFEHIVDDVNVVQSYIAEKENVHNIITLGHSMGSVILRRLLQKEAFFVSKAIIMGTLPRYNKLYSVSMIVLAHISGWFKRKKTPHTFIAKSINDSANKAYKEGRTEHDWLSSDESVVDAFYNDPLSNFVYNKYFYRVFFSCIHRVNKPQNIAKTKNVPMLFISGTDDPLSNAMNSIDRLNADYHRYNDDIETSVVAVNKARHEVLNEKNKMETYKTLLQWIQG